MVKKQGWDSDEYNKARRTGALEAEREIVKDFRRAQRPPYDPAKEIVVDLVGKFDLDADGRNTLYVELVSYEGTGPARLQVIKRGTTREGKEFRSPNIGRLQPAYASQLADLLHAGAKRAHELNGAPRGRARVG